MITNYLSPLEFVVSVKRLPNVEFFTQSIVIPSISLQPIEQASPLKNIPISGDRISYGDLPLSFIIDEDMTNYLEIFDWIKALTFPENTSQYKELTDTEEGEGEGVTSDISIVLMNSHKNQNLEINFKDCFPLNLSDVVLDTTQPDLIYPSATVTFSYNNYTIKKIGS